MKLPLDKTLRILMVEAFIRRRFVITTFFVMLALALAVGWYWPKSYTSTATIIVDEKNIIQPLMHGAAVPTEVADRARLAREIMYSRKIMNQVIDAVHMLPPNAPPVIRENLIEDMKRATAITNVGTNLIRVEYKDSDPQRANAITRHMVDFFIAENVGTKSDESKAAFNFIDAQVREYQAKVAKTEQQIKQFRTGALRPRTQGDNRETREQSLDSRVEQTQIELREAETKRATLERQLAGESSVDTTRERELRTRLNTQQQQLANLRSQYQDTYPDVIRLKSEVEELKRELASAQAQRRAQNPNAPEVGDEQSAGMYRNQLRQELAHTQGQIAALRARLSETQRLLASETETGKRSVGGVTLSEMLRDYETNQAILDDLQKRRENARVSMNLDRQKHGLSFRVHDEPSMPSQPSGPLFIHFVLGGLLLALLTPFALLYLKQQMDSRVRSAVLIRERLNLPVLTVIPHLPTPKEEVAQSRGLQWIGILVFSIAFILISVIWSGSMKV